MVQWIAGFGDLGQQMADRWKCPPSFFSDVELHMQCLDGDEGEGFVASG